MLLLLRVQDNQKVVKDFKKYLIKIFLKIKLFLKHHKNKIMRGINKVTLIGNLGKDPDVQFLEGNICVAKFPLATTETFKDKTGKLISQTEWHTVVLWRGLAELSQKYLHKGSLIYIEGRLRTRNWEDKEGHKKIATEVVADNLVMLDKRSDGTVHQTPENFDGFSSENLPPIADGNQGLPF